MKRLIATAALATLVASPAFAQSYQYNPNAGPYVGAGLGYSETDFDNGSATTTRTSIDPNVAPMSQIQVTSCLSVTNSTPTSP